MENKLITDLATNFIEEHWDDIIEDDAKKINYELVSKAEMLETIQKHYDIAGWVISEVMDWGCKENYMKQYLIEYSIDKHVIRVEDTYFTMSDDFIYVEVKPKFKRVMYFE